MAPRVLSRERREPIDLEALAVSLAPEPEEPCEPCEPPEERTARPERPVRRRAGTGDPEVLEARVADAYAEVQRLRTHALRLAEQARAAAAAVGPARDRATRLLAELRATEDGASERRSNPGSRRPPADERTDIALGEAVWLRW